VVVVQLPDGGAVRALDVIGEDLELRLGVGVGVVGQEQVHARLLGVGLLRVRRDVDAAAEHAGGAIVEDALVELPAVAVRLEVVDPEVVVHMLVAAREREPVVRAVTAFGVESGVEVVADERAAHREVVRRDGAACLLPHVQRAHVGRLLALQLHLVVVDRGAGFGEHLRDGRREIRTVARARVGLDDRRAAAGAGHDEIPRVAHGRRGTGHGHVEHVHRSRQGGVCGQPHEQAVPEQRRVESGERVIVGVHDLTEMRLDPGEVGGEGLGKTPHAGAVWQGPHARPFRREAAVDEDELVGVGTVEPVGGDLPLGDRRLGGADIGSAGDRADVGVLPVLLAPGGQAASLESIEGLAAQGVDRCAGVEAIERGGEAVGGSGGGLGGHSDHPAAGVSMSSPMCSSIQA
jgi:hypothetical protein